MKTIPLEIVPRTGDRPVSDDPMKEIWERVVVHGETPDRDVRPEIFRSWVKCREIGLDPFMEVSPSSVSDSELDRLDRENGGGECPPIQCRDGGCSGAMCATIVIYQILKNLKFLAYIVLLALLALSLMAEILVRKIRKQPINLKVAASNLSYALIAGLVLALAANIAVLLLARH